MSDGQFWLVASGLRKSRDYQNELVFENSARPWRSQKGDKGENRAEWMSGKALLETRAAQRVCLFRVKRDMAYSEIQHAARSGSCPLCSRVSPLQWCASRCSSLSDIAREFWRASLRRRESAFTVLPGISTPDFGLQPVRPGPP